MKPIQKILFPVDLSESADRIASYVIQFVKYFKAELHLLYIARTLGYFSSMYVDPSMIATMENAICEGALRGLQEFRKECFAEIPDVVAKVYAGYASTEIIRYCEKEAIDLIVMGTHGRSGLGKMMFGSVADQVLRSSKIPVTVVNPHYQVDDKMENGS